MKWPYFDFSNNMVKKYGKLSQYLGENTLVLQKANQVILMIATVCTQNCMQKIFLHKNIPY